MFTGIRQRLPQEPSEGLRFPHSESDHKAQGQRWGNAQSKGTRKLSKGARPFFQYIFRNRNYCRKVYNEQK